jgi:hypothetical protein
MEVMRLLRAAEARGQDTPLRGRLKGEEEDLLRAGIVFTGAALDATLKRLIRDTLPPLLEVNAQAHDKFETFTAQRLGTGEIADAKAVARYLVSTSPRATLIEDYIYALTGSSLQISRRSRQGGRRARRQ